MAHGKFAGGFEARNANPMTFEIAMTAILQVFNRSVSKDTEESRRVFYLCDSAPRVKLHETCTEPFPKANADLRGGCHFSFKCGQIDCTTVDVAAAWVGSGLATQRLDRRLGLTVKFDDVVGVLSTLAVQRCSMSCPRSLDSRLVRFSRFGC